MEDQSLFNNSQPSNGISEGLQNFINAMVEEIVLEGKPFDTQKKYLKKFSENEGLDYEAIEKAVTELTETLAEMKSSDSKTLLRLAVFQAKECYVSEDEVVKIVEQMKKQETEVADDVHMFYAKQNGLYGFIDVEGNMVIKPQFLSTRGFCEGLCSVELDSGWGFIDKTGKMVVEPVFDSAGSFDEGVAIVCQNDKHFLIDRKGEEVAPGVYYSFLGDGFSPRFSEGFCTCCVKNKYGFIDRTGNVVIQPQFDQVKDFHDGLALMEINDKFGYVDKNGVMVIKPQFDRAEDFEDGLAWARPKDLWGVIDKTGEFVVKPKYEYSGSPCSEGLLKDGRTVVKTEKVRAGLFRTEEIRTTETKYGIVDKKGNLVIEYRFDDARGFSDGLAAVCIGDYSTGKWGYIDKLGQMVIEPRFEEAGFFVNGLATVKINGKTGFIDKTGQIVIDPQFKYEIFHFRNGLSMVTLDDDRDAYINRSGKIVFIES